MGIFKWGYLKSHILLTVYCIWWYTDHIYSIVYFVFLGKKFIFML